MIEIAAGIEAVDGAPALYLRRLRAVVLADLHLGFEEEAARQGYYIPRVQYLRAIQALDTALSATGAEWVIFAGDVKHCFSELLRSEREELSRLFDYLRKKGLRVTVVKGNHDSYLPLVAKKYDVEVVKELLVDRILIVHGHKKVPKEYRGTIDYVVMGHEHPSIRLRDRIGFIAKLPCFLKAPYDKLGAELIVLPAVGVYQTGTTVSLSPDTYLSPILREEIDLTKIKPYVLAEDVGVLEFPELGLLEDILDQVTV